MSNRYVYRPEDYTPEQVAAGQRKINFALTEANRKLLAVLVAVKKAINVPPGLIQGRIADIEAAIEEASKSINQVAEIIPPGCDPKLP